MARRPAPKFCFLLLWFAIYIPAHTGGHGRGGKVLGDPLSSVDSIKSGNRVKRSLSGEDDDSLNSGEFSTFSSRIANIHRYMKCRVYMHELT